MRFILGWAARLAAALVIGAWGISSEAQPLTIHDVLEAESFGDASFAPDGRSAVYERFAGWSSAERYDLSYWSGWTTAELHVVDVDKEGPSRRLLRASEGHGHVLGAWSPTGKWLAIYRLRGDRLDLGIVEVGQGRVRWTGLSPNLSALGKTIAWADDDTLIVSALEQPGLPWLMRQYGAPDSVMSRWRQTRQGNEPARVLVDTRAGVAKAAEAAPASVLSAIDARTGAVRVLERGVVLDFEPSPDERHLAYLSAEETLPLIRGQVLVQSAMPKRSRLSILTLSDLTKVTVGETVDVAPHLLSWDPTGREVLVWARRDGDAWSEGGLVSFSATGGTERRFLHGTLDPMSEGDGIDQLRGVRAIWLGGRPALYARAPSSDRFDWWLLGDGSPANLTADFHTSPLIIEALGDQSVAFVADGDAWRLDVNGRRLRLHADDDVSSLRTGLAMPILRVGVNDPPHRDWFMVGGPRGLSVISAKGEAGLKLGCLDEAQGARILATSSEAAILRVRSQGVTRLWLARPHGCLALDQANVQFSARPQIRVERIEHADHRGRQTFSLLYIPPSASVSLKGVVVSGYPGNETGGPYYEAGLRYVGVNPLLIAGQGYAWLQAATPLSDHSTSPVDGFQDNLDLAVAAAKVQFPDLPWDRVALYGHSFGGYGALVVASQTAQYKAIIASAPTTNLVSAWGEFSPIERDDPQMGLSLNDRMGWAEVGQGAMRKPPWEAPQTYADASPVMQAGKIVSPVLLITGDRDFVPASGAEQMFSALHRQGRDARIITYGGEGHFQWSPANQIDVYAQILAWLDERLGPAKVRSDF